MNRRFSVQGIGIWIRGIQDWESYEQAAKRDYSGINDELPNPAPEAIPARERRRSPKLVRLAVEVIYQACNMAKVDKTTIPTVFTSIMGDTEIAAYMCRTLAGEDKMLSPTRFHNSVNNAPSGYWSIAAGNRAASSFVGGFVNSFGVALLECITLCESENNSVALVAYDTATEMPFADICPIAEDFGCALIVAPGSHDENYGQIDVSLGRISETNEKGASDFVTERIAANPAAVGLKLLHALARNERDTIHFQTGSNSVISVTTLGVSE